MKSKYQKPVANGMVVEMHVVYCIDLILVKEERVENGSKQVLFVL